MSHLTHETTWTDGPVTVYGGDVRTVLAQLPAESVQTVVTSPPYWGLRDYGVDAQLGLEATPEEYVANMVAVFREVRRVLRRDGTCWLNLGDSYAGLWGAQGHRETPATLSRNRILNHPKRASLTGKITEAGLKPKDLVGIPWRVAFALQADGWWLRSDIIWSKPNPMPESVTDRPTKAHEYLFLLAKAERYYYDADAIREKALWPDGPNSPESIQSPYGQGFSRINSAHMNGTSRNDGDRWRLAGDGVAERGARNKRTVWEIATQPYREAHFATYPEALVEPCIKAGSREGDTVLDPFAGSGTTLAVARRLGRKAVGIELNPDYIELIRKRVQGSALPLLEMLS